MEENKTKRIITKEQIDTVLGSFSKAETKAKEENLESGIDFEKAKEVINSFEGLSVETVISIISTAILTLPLEAMALVVDTSKKALKAKASITLLKLLAGDDKQQESGVCSDPENKEQKNG